MACIVLLQSLKIHEMAQENHHEGLLSSKCEISDYRQEISLNTNVIMPQLRIHNTF